MDFSEYLNEIVNFLETVKIGYYTGMIGVALISFGDNDVFEKFILSFIAFLICAIIGEIIRSVIVFLILNSTILWAQIFYVYLVCIMMKSIYRWMFPKNN